MPIFALTVAPNALLDRDFSYDASGLPSLNTCRARDPLQETMN
nr:hypothetical protein Hi04_10k_c4997_00020 [uncultured bacterium]